MSTWSNREKLYGLLPAIYRLRDAAEGEPLRALLSVIERQLELVEGDIEGLYENWFVETADEWAIPYIGDLLGVRSLHVIESTGVLSNRAYVANTLRYRRRKGTAAVLEQLARDVSNWPARVVEFFELLATTQHLNHLRPHNVRTPDLRETDALELLGTPFTSAPRTGEVRHIRSQRGRWNIPNIGLFLWRLQPYIITRSSARPVTGPPGGRYWFHPVGRDAPLFNRPQTEPDISHIAREISVPGELRRRALYDDLEQYRASLVAGNSTPATEYFGTQPVLRVYFNEDNDPLPPEEITACDLSQWDAAGWSPPPSQAFVRADGSPFSTRVAVDPKLGRLAVLGGAPEVTSVQVDHSYGFSSDVGGGPYDRQAAVDALLSRPVTWQVGVSQTATPILGQVFSSLTAAISEWNAQPAGTVGVIAVMDSLTYQEDLQGAQAIQIPEESQLLIVAADWPEEPLPELAGVTQRVIGRLVPNRLRPHLQGNISVRGTAAASDTSPGVLSIDGLLVEGRVTVLIGNLGGLGLSHCTLVPDEGGLRVNSSASNTTENDRLQVRLVSTICGPLDVAGTVPRLSITDSIVQAHSGDAIAAPGSDATVNTSTIIGPVAARSLNASEVIFNGTVTVRRRQTGCVRFSHVPADSRTPRRYRCQPDLNLKDITDADEQRRIRARLTPFFTADDYGQPAYMQLAPGIANEILTGAEDGAEMGVFNHLKQPQREANLRQALREYLRFGLEAGIFYIT